MNQFEKICKDIESIKIQGAENVARAAVVALKYKSHPSAVKKLISLRPTEPALRNAIKYAQLHGIKSALDFLDECDEKINKAGSALIKNGMNVYTHCHSSTVNRIFVQSKKEGKRITVYNTETRPLLQGRITSTQLAKQGIKNVHGVDGAMRELLAHCQMAMIGADAITRSCVINKIGSGEAGLIAHSLKVPLYVASVAWKIDPVAWRNDREKVEQRAKSEVWNDVPKGVKVVNPAFEHVERDLIKGIVSEFGVLSYGAFVKRVEKEYAWLFR